MSDLDTKTPSRRLWVIAALCAVMLHGVGIAAAVYEMQRQDDDDGLGAAGIEVGMEMVSADVEESELPQGEDSSQQAASQAVQEQKAVEKESDLPKEMPHESEDADRVVSETDSQKQKEEEPDKALKKQEAQEAAQASEAAARQRIEDTKVGEKQAVLNAGLLRDKKRMTEKWGKQLTAYLQSNKRYPDVEKGKNVTVKIIFELDRLGKVISSSISESSGDPAFDEAAISILHRAKYLPKPPPEIADEGLSFSVDIKFTEGRK